MPTSTDLVTDLPADFEVFGQAVATSMADLLGGTTGQVLSKTSNTDMDFTWVAQDDSNAIQNAIVDAKGDLIGATAADTPARLAVGTNGQVLTADSAEATGIKWATAASGLTLIQTATPSATATVNFNNCFSATCQNYLVIVNVTGTSAQDITLRLRASGTDATTNYTRQLFRADGAGLTGAKTSPGYWDSGATRTSGRSFNLINIASPFEAAETSYFANAQDPNTGAVVDIRCGQNTNATSYDGLSVYITAGTMTGTIRVYGVQNS